MSRRISSLNTHKMSRQERMGRCGNTTCSSRSILNKLEDDQGCTKEKPKQRRHCDKEA
ncbi:hypothetical protein J1N35_004837 [Gossypium stocksii]|uniref:Uncharacterized protein n=1 Tax=Gossypium stocksii TaxID=47602 RepID=A0A9D3WCR8_9ROSI|nr:hypothetical protein J1N35_004837 [Gossypium stocksii]